MNIYSNPANSKMYSIQLKPPEYFLAISRRRRVGQLLCPWGLSCSIFCQPNKLSSYNSKYFSNFYVRLFWHKNFLVINRHFQLWSNHVMILIFEKMPFFQVLNILSHKSIIREIVQGKYWRRPYFNDVE